MRSHGGRRRTYGDDRLSPCTNAKAGAIRTMSTPPAVEFAKQGMPSLVLDLGLVLLCLIVHGVVERSGVRRVRKHGAL